MTENAFYVTRARGEELQRYSEESAFPVSRIAC
jgi:hypothetical protein